MIIGITGGIGSGKSLVAKELYSFENTVYYHADEEAKKLVNTSSSIKNKIIKIFGKESYLDGKLNRKFISELVFKDSVLLGKLNGIIHPEVKIHFKNFSINNLIQWNFIEQLSSRSILNTQISTTSQFFILKLKISLGISTYCFNRCSTKIIIHIVTTAN